MYYFILLPGLSPHLVVAAMVIDGSLPLSPVVRHLCFQYDRLNEQFIYKIFLMLKNVSKSVVSEHPKTY